jgi:tetratricopeptide (TPR) repeat protein
MGLTGRDHQILRSIVTEAKAAAQTPEAIGLAVRRLVKAKTPSPPREEDVAPQFARQRLRAVFDSLVARTEAEVLGLTESPSLEQIDMAFERLARRWRPGPDLRGTDSEDAKLVKGIYMRIEQAYRRLRAQAAPPAERPLPSQTPTVQAMSRVSHEPSAKEQHRRLLTQAIDLLKSKRYRDSMDVLSRARRLRPEHTQTGVLLCFARARQALIDRDVPQARGHYEEALRLDPSNVNARKELLILSAMMGPNHVHPAVSPA